MEKSGALKVRRECDAVIKKGEAGSPPVLAAMVAKGYSHLNDGAQPPNPGSIQEASKVFQELADSGNPTWVLNGLIGLAQVRGLQALYEPGLPYAEEMEKILNTIRAKFPGTIHAALALNTIVGAYRNRRKPEEALARARWLLELPNYKVIRVGERPWFSHLGFEKGLLCYTRL